MEFDRWLMGGGGVGGENVRRGDRGYPGHPQPAPLRFYVTGYTIDCEGCTGFEYDTGRPARVGRTAACPPHLATGTMLVIEGVGVRTCYDRGGAIKGRRLDVLVSTVREAHALTGVREIVVMGGGR